jgi:hypothetical protein
MKEREGIVVTGVLTVLLLAWLGFLVHRSPRFPGSGVGAVFGIAGTVLMLIPLASQVFENRLAKPIAIADRACRMVGRAVTLDAKDKRTGFFGMAYGYIDEETCHPEVRYNLKSALL